MKNLEPNSYAPALEILMHELMVHKVELEMQNEELKSTQNIIEESRDSYVDYYEFAPVGILRSVEMASYAKLI